MQTYEFFILYVLTLERWYPFSNASKYLATSAIFVGYSTISKAFESSIKCSGTWDNTSAIVGVNDP